MNTLNKTLPLFFASPYFSIYMFNKKSPLRKEEAQGDLQCLNCEKLAGGLKFSTVEA